MPTKKTTKQITADSSGLDLSSLMSILVAVEKGDFSKRMPDSLVGLEGKIADKMNSVIDLNESLTNELKRISLTVGKEGKVAERASLAGVKGAWSDAIDSVNHLISDLVSPTLELSRVIDAVAQGDLTQKMMMEIEGKAIMGEFKRLGTTMNKMVAQLASFAEEVTRVAREVGVEGKLGGQAEIGGVSGIWKELTNNVNMMASNLTNQVRNIAEVTTAVAKGDLTKTITVEAKGEIQDLKNTINTMVGQLSSFADEVTRVSQEVGKEGKLGGQAKVQGVAGTWRALTESVNMMADNLTSQVRSIAEVTTAVAQGDLTKTITVEAQGEIQELKNTINTMVGQLSSFADEVTRVASEVGTDGKLGGQADVKGVAGTWRDLTESVNQMANNLTYQVRNIADVTTAVAQGDLSKKIDVEASGEILDLKDTINTMVDQLGSFADEVTRVARDVGIQGILGGQADVKGVSGTWRDLTDNVNMMANNLTNQVRSIAEVTTAVAQGDLTKTITVEAQGEIQELKNTINTMVGQLGSFADEVTRVAREVGTEGELGGQADVKDVSGTWRALTDSVNMMAENLTSQVRSIAEVTTAVANGDLTKKIEVEAQGEIQDLKNTINIMVDQLSSFADEVTRVARDVGTEGILGGQAKVKDVSGTWKELTENVNMMASNLTNQVRNIAEITTAVANGDLTKKITIEARGEILTLKQTVNEMVDQLNSFASEVTRVSREVGTEGKLGGKAEVMGVSGTWKELTDNVNMMAMNITNQIRNIAEVTTSVANGDLTKLITVDAQGEILVLKDTINRMVEQLSSFADEVTRVAREVGTEGELGGQAMVKGVAGTWMDLTNNVNMMARNLTNQVRGIAKVVTAVANGDLRQKLALEARGEIADLAETINEMIDTLDTFANQVTTVAREVGTEGKLGGQANVPGASGTWKDLTDNVNQLADNLTTQVRAIAEVATAVTKGDLTRAITVEASGEVSDLKDNINVMIESLRETTRINEEQDWLKTNLTKLTRLLQGQKDVMTVANMILSELAETIQAQHIVFYINEETIEEDANLKLLASYAFKERKNLSSEFREGEGLIGQCALEKKRIVISEVPNDYVKISSGLGEATPMNIAVIPILFESQLIAIIEMASFNRFTSTSLDFLDQLAESIGVMINTITANMRTEALLKQSQTQAKDLQQSEELLKQQQEELQRTNEELEEKASLLSEQKSEVEEKNQEVELAKLSLEEKAEQLALTSKFKSQFLANMSHELRTPLNSLLVLAKILGENQEENLTNKQVEFAETIQKSGEELLSLINEILDLSKIESGTIQLDNEKISFSSITAQIQRNYQQVAEEKSLEFKVALDENLPENIHTDRKRLMQIIRNLLSNAFKFTHEGFVELSVRTAAEGWSPDHKILEQSDINIAFCIKDSGVGIEKEKQKLIFEAFQQADGDITRGYGGTGLGLSISRELSYLLGGEIRLESEPGTGSEFILYLPQTFDPSELQSSTLSLDPVIKLEKSVQVTDDAGSFEIDEYKDLLSQLPLDLHDDRDQIGEDDRVVLVIEDDLGFAQTLVEIVHEIHFKGIIALNGELGLLMAEKYKPDAIILDIYLPAMNGWTVLDRLKHNLNLRHIPVHVITAAEDWKLGLRLGALTFLHKPASRESISDTLSRIKDSIDQPARRLLLVEDNKADRESICEFISEDDIEIVAVESGEDAIKKLNELSFDCMVLDLKLPGISGFEVLQKIRENEQFAKLPVVVYTAKDLTPEEQSELDRLSEKVIQKDEKSIERLLDETSLFLHRVKSQLSPDKQKIIERFHQKDPELKGKTILIVDDDIRNVFAVTSLLERHEVIVLTAENGKQALSVLKKNTQIDLVLMDIMMPEMDGYEATKKLRQMEGLKTLPVIALTAKAMKGDREKCIEAGASDYITKPLNTDQLLSLLRVWLYT